MHQKISSVVVSLEVSRFRLTVTPEAKNDVRLFNFSCYQIWYENIPSYLSSVQSLSHLLFAPPMARKRGVRKMQVTACWKAPREHQWCLLELEIFLEICTDTEQIHDYLSVFGIICCWTYQGQRSIIKADKLNLVKLSIRIKPPKEKEVIKDNK